jgi:UDP-glucose-4-epimerase GalE
LSNILVTGGSGYVGSHVAKVLFERGHVPVVFDLQVKQRPWASPSWPSVAGDINNKWSLDFLFEAWKFDAVIHLAASSEVGASVTDPLRYYQNNVNGSAELLNACKEHKVNKFIFSSTSAVYGEVHPSKLPTCEHYLKNPTTSYGSSKWAVENMLRDADRAHGIRSVSLRYFNASGASPDGTIGEYRVKPTHLIPSIQAVVDGKYDEFKINGNAYLTPDGTAVRDYAHVWDIAEAHVSALEYLNNGGETDAFNIGSGHGTSVLEMLNEYQRQVGQSIVVSIGPNRPGDIAINYADIRRAKEILNWTPKLSNPESIVRDAINWYSSNRYKGLANVC